MPDVEGFRAVLGEHGAGHRIDCVQVADAGVLRGVTAGRLGRLLRGRIFREPERHGKWLIAPTDGPVLLLHFGMTGRLYWAEQSEPRHAHDRVIFSVHGGELRFRDMRKLQGISVAERREDVGRVTGELGPDALAVGRGEFGQALGSGRQAVKARLMDQTVIAGLGNLLADEVLWRARINPRRPVGQLDSADRARLHDQMRRVLRAAVPTGQVPAKPRWLTAQRDRNKPRCPRCRTDLARGRVAGRGTFWCPHCQAS